MTGSNCRVHMSIYKLAPEQAASGTVVEFAFYSLPSNNMKSGCFTVGLEKTIGYVYINTQSAFPALGKKNTCTKSL